MENEKRFRYTTYKVRNSRKGLFLGGKKWQVYHLKISAKNIQMDLKQ